MKDYISTELLILFRERERERACPHKLAFFIGASVVLGRCVDVLGKASKSVLVSEMYKTLCRWIVSRILRLSAKIVDVSLFIYSCMQCSEFSLTNPQPWRTISNKTNCQELKEKKFDEIASMLSSVCTWCKTVINFAPLFHIYTEMYQSNFWCRSISGQSNLIACLLLKRI